MRIKLSSYVWLASYFVATLFLLLH